jgi:hypothetical protein
VRGNDLAEFGVCVTLIFVEGIDQSHEKLFLV